MINSLIVKNFKCLENLEIRNFNRINLLTGKNNTGKSTLLEAIALFATKGDFETLNNIIALRGISFNQTDSTDVDKIAGLFNNWKKDFSELGSIRISEMHSLRFNEMLLFRLVKYLEEDSLNKLDVPYTRKVVIENGDQVTFDEIDIRIGLQRSVGENKTVIPLDRLGRQRDVRNQQITYSGIQFVRSGVDSDELNSKLWDKITLTTKENNVIDSLKIIHPSLTGLSFVEVGRSRTPIAKLTDPDVVVPLKSMGDGMNRILNLLLALVNAQGGVLLIDEFENGLHYTVQKELWKMIFNLSVSMDVQVFATTHSSDCIEAFTSVMEGSEDLNIGRLIRLDNRAGRIESVEYSPEEMKIAKQYDLETR